MKDLYLEELNREIKYLTEQVEDDASYLRGRLIEIERKLENFDTEKGDYTGLNSLGELQGNGVKLDCRIVELTLLVETRKKYLGIKKFEAEKVK